MGDEPGQTHPERRWAIVASDGRHVWLGRNSDPSPEEIAEAEAALARQGTPGWLVVVSGDYWSGDPLDFLVVRGLAGAEEEGWPQARAAFLASRGERLRSMG